MTRPSHAAALAGLLVLLVACAAQAQRVAPADDGAVKLEDGSELWMVEFTTPPMTDNGRLSSILLEQSTFRAAVEGAGLRARERMAFHSLWNGLSVAVHPEDVAQLRDLPGVAAIYPARVVQGPETPQAFEPDLLTALAMTGADIAHTELGLTGAGIKVGIIDTGIDYDHPDLGGDGVIRRNSPVFPTARVVAGYDFVGDHFGGANTPSPDPFPDDCYGHGTHVAGIVGAKGGITGVAPGVLLGAYRIFGCGPGNTTSDIIIAALERALDDGMQIVNLSLGNPFQWPSEPTAQACDRLVKRGVVVVAAIGNNGSSGLYAAGSPGVGEDVIGVGSFDNTHFNTPLFKVSTDAALFPYITAIGGRPAPVSGVFPLARTGTVASLADACDPLPPGSLAGKVALIRRGTCSINGKARAAQAAGAVAVVVYNDVIGDFTPDVRGVVVPTIPVVGVSQARGQLLDTRLASGPVDLIWTIASTPNTLTGGFLSNFSSYGPTPELDIKPDLAAPGGFITSTFPLEQGGYTSFTGTSMASPHVAGAVALLLEAHPRTRAQEVRGILMNTASPRLHAGLPSGLEVVHRQGAGMLDIPAAVLATTRVTPEKLTLGESAAGPAVRTLMIENEGRVAVTYALSHAAALATGPDTYTPAFVTGEATVTFGVGQVRVPAGGRAKLAVTITAPALEEGSLYGGYLVLTPDDGGREVRVPYAGYTGDYQSLPVLTSNALGTPALGRQVGFSFLRQPHGATYTMVGTDVPYIVVHFDRPASEVTMDVTDATTGHDLHPMFVAHDYPRSVAGQTETAFPWRGTVLDGKHTRTVPDGRYTVTVNVLKPLGGRKDPAAWESWTSPVITLARPSLGVVSPPTVTPAAIHTGDEVAVAATVGNTGVSEAKAVKVVFYDGAVAFDSTTVDLLPAHAQVAQGAWVAGDPGTHTLKVVVDPDGQVLELNRNDNSATTRVTVQPAVEVLAADPAGRRELSLAPARPDPFGGRVEFRFSLPQAGPADLAIYDLLGRRLRAWRWSALPPGEHTIAWDGRGDDGRDAPAGILLVRLSTAGRSLTRKVVRLP